MKKRKDFNGCGQMIVRNVAGEVVPGILDTSRTFGVEWYDCDGDVRAEGVCYDVRHATDLAAAMRCYEQLFADSPHPPVLSAAVIAYDENGKIHVIAQFPKQPKNVLDS